MQLYWFKWFHGTLSDDKWPLIARQSKQSVAVVVAVWAALQECASQGEPRGSIAQFDPEKIDALLQLDEGTCKTIIHYLALGMSPKIQDNMLVGFAEKQAEIRDPTGAERKRRQREREKLRKQAEQHSSNITLCSSDTIDKRHTDTGDSVTLASHNDPQAGTSRVDLKRSEIRSKKEDLTTPPIVYLKLIMT